MKKLFPLVGLAFLACGTESKDIAEDLVELSESPQIVEDTISSEISQKHFLLETWDYGFNIENEERNRVYSKDSSYTIYYNISSDTNLARVSRDTVDGTIHQTREALSYLSIQVFKSGIDGPIWNVKLDKESCRGDYTYQIHNVGIDKYETLDKTIDSEFLSLWKSSDYKINIIDGIIEATVILEHREEYYQGFCYVGWKFPIQTGTDPERTLAFEEDFY